VQRHRDDQYAEAHRLYSGLRDVAYCKALARCIAHGAADFATRITPITAEALAAYQSSWAGKTHWSGDGGWPWDLLVASVLKKPRSFHVAVWSGTRLCGLAVGSVSKGRRQLMLRFMECCPDPDHPLRNRIALIVFEAATAFADALGAERILLRNPLPGVRRFYERFGFALAFERGGAVYFVRNLS
jgi:hypothetical protein